MARPKKTGLDYFPLDCVLDDKFEAIESLHGNDGFIWLIKFYQKAYQTEYGEVDVRGLFGELLANKCRITIEKQDKIIKDCITIGLLIKTDQGLFTSNGIKKRISAVSDERKRAIERQNKRKELKQNKYKVKESKVKETPHYSLNNSNYSPNNNIFNQEPNFETAWNMYPKRDGKKMAYKHYKATVPNQITHDQLIKAIENYKAKLIRDKTETQYIKAGSTFFNNWQDWINPEINLPVEIDYFEKIVQNLIIDKNDDNLWRGIPVEIVNKLLPVKFATQLVNANLKYDKRNLRVIYDNAINKQEVLF